MYNLDLCISSRNVRRAEVVIFTYGWLVCLVLTMQIDKWQVVWLVVIHNTNTYFYSACTLVFNLQSFTKKKYFQNIFHKTKGQVISKCLFCFFNFFQKTDKNGRILKVSKSQSNFFLKLHSPKNEQNI